MIEAVLIGAVMISAYLFTGPSDSQSLAQCSQLDTVATETKPVTTTEGQEGSAELETVLESCPKRGLEKKVVLRIELPGVDLLGPELHQPEMKAIAGEGFKACSFSQDVANDFQVLGTTVECEAGRVAVLEEEKVQGKILEFPTEVELQKSQFDEQRISF